MPLAVCATPIGNLADVTLRVLEELAAAELCSCEDTRHTRVLLERHGVEASLLSYHQHNEASGAPSSCRASLPASGWRSSRTPACPG